MASAQWAVIQNTHIVTCCVDQVQKHGRLEAVAVLRFTMQQRPLGQRAAAFMHELVKQRIVCRPFKALI